MKSIVMLSMYDCNTYFFNHNISQFFNQINCNPIEKYLTNLFLCIDVKLPEFQKIYSVQSKLISDQEISIPLIVRVSF